MIFLQKYGIHKMPYVLDSEKTNFRKAIRAWHKRVFCSFEQKCQNKRMLLWEIIFASQFPVVFFSFFFWIDELLGNRANQIVETKCLEAFLYSIEVFSVMLWIPNHVSSHFPFALAKWSKFSHISESIHIFAKKKKILRLIIIIIIIKNSKD